LAYKLLAIDLDGTLLTREGRAHDADLEALWRLQRSGVPVTINTGRMYSGTRDAAELAQIVGPVACLDGSQIVHSGTHDLIDHAPIEPGLVGRLREALRGHAVAGFVMAHDEIVHDERGEDFVHFVRIWSKKVSRHHDHVADHPHWHHPAGVSELVCVGSEAAIRGVHGVVQQAAGGGEGEGQSAIFALNQPLQVVDGHPSPPWGMVVRAAGRSKGTAVGWLARHHGCEPGDVVVVGDWLNDLPMFRAAGRSFAMGQAPGEVKAAATDVLEATITTGGGIAEAARRAGWL
jgi:hypothetical protein